MLSLVPALLVNWQTMVNTPELQLKLKRMHIAPTQNLSFEI